MPTKATPKSCSCRACRRGRGSRLQKFRARCEERAFRRSVKQALRKGEEPEQAAPYGDYRD